MSHDPNVAAAASLIADPARALMLTVLLDGRALPAGDLAYASGVTAQTASSHLAKLLAGGMLTVETEGRHRYYRLAGPHVAQAIEQLAVIQPVGPVRRKALTAQAKELQLARCCYDHLAGRLGVAVARAFEERGFIVPAAGKQYEVTPVGVSWFATIGLDVGAVRPCRRGLARQCLDWTERTYHVAGPLGVRFMQVACERGWLRRASQSRAVTVTPVGRTELKRHLGVEAEALRAAA